MCGRYVISKRPDQLAMEFDAALLAPDFVDDYNVAPTKDVLAVLTRPAGASAAEPSPERQLRAVRWGLVPSWAKDPSVGSKLINARVETAAEKPSFRSAFAKRRCIIPASGYYEWQATDVELSSGKKAAKQPYYIHRPDQATLAMAGLYELWRDPTRERDDPHAWLWTATVLTTEATDELGRIHDRAPLIVPAETYERWLAPEQSDPDELRGLLVPATVGMVAEPVSTAVNNVRNNGPELIEPLAQHGG